MIGIRSRSYVEVKLQLLAVRPVYQVDAWIYLVAVDFAIGGDSRMPFGGIVADEIIDDARQSPAAPHHERLPGAGQPHANHRVATMFPARHTVVVEQDRLLAGQKSRIAASPSQEANFAGCLALDSTRNITEPG